MKRLLIFALGFLFVSSAAFPQAGHIGLYSDASFTDCELIDNIPEVKTVYVVHKYTPGATGSQFDIGSGGGFNCIWIAETSIDTRICDPGPCPYISYGGCLASDIVVKVLTYFCQGISAPCAYLQIVPKEGNTVIVVYDCDSGALVGNGGIMYVNADGSCFCRVPSEETHWGKIKALYE